MGNCQAIDAAALVIQHPSGKIERLYWPISASEVMRLNPGHYVSLIIPLPASASASDSGSDHHHQEEEIREQKSSGGGAVRFTRVKLLRPNETLALGHAYRLVTTQEVMKVLRAKKYAKTKKQQVESLIEKSSQTAVPEKQSSSCEAEDKENINHATNHERRRPRTASGNAAGAAMRSKSWRPSLQSISEAAS
ncbi:uncharacterized protein LOC133712531 [Rosa rugosa]|uniref:uncharacterized protein LOC133712531 n=1 Tax=Rosa rugosa TaxID=74645 RepID=UPI002B416B51|nr:uncharacterized protein LOC133712531 [Rosa rugosa]